MGLVVVVVCILQFGEEQNYSDKNIKYSKAMAK